MSIQALPYITLLGFFFGSTLIASRFSVGQFSPSTYVGLRLSMAGLGHLALYAVARNRFRWPRDRRTWRHAALLGILGTALPMTAIVTSLQYLSSGIASVLVTTNPAITVLMAHFMLSDERLNGRKMIGVGLALGGAALLALSGESGLSEAGPTPPIGYLLMFAAMIAASGMTIYARKYMTDLNPFDVASIRMVVAAMVVMPLSALIVGFDLQAVTGQGYAALTYAALVGTFAGMLLAFYNVQRFGATASAMTAYIIPMVAVIGGWLLLDETITVTMLSGMALIIVGIAILNQRAGT